MKGTAFQPRVLQLNLDNMNRLPHSKHPIEKNRGICQCGNRTHDLRARQTPKPLDHWLPWIYHGENVGRSWVMGNITNTTIHSHMRTLEQETMMLHHVPSTWVQPSMKWPCILYKNISEATIFFGMGGSWIFKSTSAIFLWPPIWW